MKYKKNGLFSAVILSTLVMLAGCDFAKNQMQHDRSADLNRQDYRDALSARPIENFDDNSIPELQSFVATPAELKERMPLVSVSVNQTVPVRDLLFELADQAEIDLELDPQIRGSIIFTARERPFDEVIDRITNMAGLRYLFNGNLLRIEIDSPYLKTYKLDYLNFVRTIETELSLDVSVVSTDEGEVGSASKLETEMESDFWSELDTNIEQILTSSDNYRSLATLSDPKSMPRAAYSPPPPIPVKSGGITSTTAQSNVPPPPPGPPILEVKIPTSSKDPVDSIPAATFSINRQAGLVSIYATARQQGEIKGYLKVLREVSTAQVLIEAKILEVGLTDEYSAGIQWNSLQEINFTGLATASAGFANPGLVPAATGGTFTMALKPGSDINLAASAISRFGTVRALSSPRISVINNQAAVLNMVENRIFFELDVDNEEDTDTNTSNTTVESEIRSVPVGIMVSVVPTVNLDTEEITLAIRPTITRVTDTIEDPGIAIALLTADAANAGILSQVSSPIPQLAVQELDSIIKTQSGQVIVMGGLLQDRNDIEELGVPILSELPVFGHLFKNHSDRIVKTELVIFVKATIIPGSNIDDMDKDLYNTFSFDRHPFRM